MGLDLLIDEMGGALLSICSGGLGIAMLALLLNYVCGF